MILAITQARFGSTRLPGKVLKEVRGKTMLQIHLERLKASKKLDQIMVATTFEPEAGEIVRIADEMGVRTFKGSTLNVLERYYKCASQIKPEYVVRITSDCPLIDPQEIDYLIDGFLNGKYDYASNGMNPTFPDGMDAEIFTFSALEKAYHNASLPEDMEHVTSYIWKNSTFWGGTLFKSFNYHGQLDFSCYRLTLDTPNDFDNIRILIEHLGDRKTWREYVNFVDQNPHLFINIKTK